MELHGLTLDRLISAGYSQDELGDLDVFQLTALAKLREENHRHDLLTAFHVYLVAAQGDEKSIKEMAKELSARPGVDRNDASEFLSAVRSGAIG